MAFIRRKVLLHAVFCSVALLSTLHLSCCTTSCSSFGSPGCICTCTSTTSDPSTSTTSSTTSTSISTSSEASSTTSTSSATSTSISTSSETSTSTSTSTTSTRETTTTGSLTSSSPSTTTSSSTSIRSSTTRSASATTTSSTSSQSPPTENDQGRSEIGSRTPEPGSSVTTQDTQVSESHDSDSSSPLSTGRNNGQDNSDHGNNNGEESSNDDRNTTYDATTQIAENNFNETDVLNRTNILIVEGSTKRVVSIVLPLICCFVFVMILIIFLAKKYKMKTRFKNHIESQVTYDLEEDFDNANEGDLDPEFSHGDNTAVVAEHWKPDNRGRKRSKPEMVLNNTSLTIEEATRLEGSTAEVFSGNGKGLSYNNNNKKKFISENGNGANSPQEHTEMNQPGKGLSCDENKQKLMSENRSGANTPKEHPLMNRSVAWDGSNKLGDRIINEKDSSEMKRHENHTTFSDDVQDIEEIPVVADEQEIEEIETKAKQASDGEKDGEFEEKERKDTISRQSSKTPVTHLSAADVEELEKLKNREKNSTKMLKKLRSVLNMVITEEDVTECEDAAERVRENVVDMKSHFVTKADLKKSQKEIDSFDETEDSQKDIKAKNSTTKLDPEIDDREESLCSWDSDTEPEKEIEDLFLKEEEIKETSGERKSPDGAEMEIPIDSSLCKAYIMWLIWCKQRCTCGDFLENPFGKDSTAIEKELMRNTEEYMKDNFRYKREFGFRVQTADRNLKDEMTLKSFVNNNIGIDPLEKTKRYKKTTQNSATDEFDVLEMAIEAVHYAQSKSLPYDRHEHHSAKNQREQRESVEDVDKASNVTVERKGSNRKTKRKNKKSKKYLKVKDFDNHQKSMRTVNISEATDGRYERADVRRSIKTSEIKDLPYTNRGNVEYDLSEGNQTTTESNSSDTQNNVLAFEEVHSDSDDENDVFLAGRSNPVGKKKHQDYVTDSDDEDNFIVLRSSTTKYPAKEKSQGSGNTEKISGRNILDVINEKIEKADISPPKTSVSFDKSKSFSKCLSGDMDENKKANIPGEMETKSVTVPFESKLEAEARRKPRVMRHLSLEQENGAENRDNKGKSKIRKRTEKRRRQFETAEKDKGENIQKGQDDHIFKRHGFTARNCDDEEVEPATYLPSFVKNAPKIKLPTTEISNAHEIDKNALSITVGEAAQDQLGKAAVLGRRRTRNSAKEEFQSRTSSKTQHMADQDESSQLSSDEWKANQNEIRTDCEDFKSGGRRSSGISDRNLSNGNITAVDDRKYPFQAMTKQSSSSNEKNKIRADKNDKVNTDYDDADALYFAGCEVLNENVHTYEVTQAKPETYGKATVIRHGKK